MATHQLPCTPYRPRGTARIVKKWSNEEQHATHVQVHMILGLLNKDDLRIWSKLEKCAKFARRLGPPRIGGTIGKWMLFWGGHADTMSTMKTASMIISTGTWRILCGRNTRRTTHVERDEHHGHPTCIPIWFNRVRPCCNKWCRRAYPSILFIWILKSLLTWLRFQDKISSPLEALQALPCNLKWHKGNRVRGSSHSSHRLSSNQAPTHDLLCTTTCVLLATDYLLGHRTSREALKLASGTFWKRSS